MSVQFIPDEQVFRALVVHRLAEQRCSSLARANIPRQSRAAEAARGHFAPAGNETLHPVPGGGTIEQESWHMGAIIKLVRETSIPDKQVAPNGKFDDQKFNPKRHRADRRSTIGKKNDDFCGSAKGSSDVSAGSRRGIQLVSQFPIDGVAISRLSRSMCCFV